MRQGTLEKKHEVLVRAYSEARIDIQKLKAEVDRLTKENAEALSLGDLTAERKRLEEEIAEMKQYFSESVEKIIAKLDVEN